MQPALAAALSLTDAFPETAQSDFKPDLVAVLKTVRHGFGHAIHSHGNPINSHVDDTLRQRVAGEADETQAEPVHYGFSRLPINGHPDQV